MNDDPNEIYPVPCELSKEAESLFQYLKTTIGYKNGWHIGHDTFDARLFQLGYTVSQLQEVKKSRRILFYSTESEYQLYMNDRKPVEST